MGTLGQRPTTTRIRDVPLWWPLVRIPYFYEGTKAKDCGSMSDPGTTYRTREEVQRMRSTQDPIRGLQRYIEEWGVATDADLKASSDKSSISFPARVLTGNCAI